MIEDGDAIPRIEDIDGPWLTRCLQRNGVAAADVRGFTAAPIDTGQTAACVRFDIEYRIAAPGLPRSLVAKFPSEDPLSRSSAAAMGIYRREVEFYHDVAPRLSIRVPRCYYAAVDESGQDFLILMDDLEPARAGDQIAGCSPGVARAAVLELVGLQAPTWNDAALGQRFAEPEDGFFSDMLGLYRRMLPTFVDRFAAGLEPDELAIIEALGDASGAPPFQAVGSPFCLEHRDYRLDNLMIDERGATPRVTVLDWQGMRTGRPLNDVALCLAGSLAPAERRECETSVLQAYHDALCAAGVEDFSWSQCWHEYRRAAFAGFGLTVVAAGAVEQTARGDAMFTAMARRYTRHALDVDAVALLG